MRHEILDSIVLGVVMVLATAEAVTQYAFHHDQRSCLAIGLIAALLLVAIHWPQRRRGAGKDAPPAASRAAGNKPF